MATSVLALGFSGIHILENTPVILRTVLTNVTADELDWQPAPDRWSISMVLAHLADVEEHGFVSRFTAMVNRSNPFLPAYDQLALFRAGAKFEGLVELQKFERRRAETLAWMKSLPMSVKSRSARHEELGILSFEELLNEFAFHDLGHVRQIMELYRSRAFYPNMGVFQNYYKINP